MKKKNISSVIKKVSETELFRTYSDDNAMDILFDYSIFDYQEDPNFIFESSFADEKVFHPFIIREENSNVIFHSLPFAVDVGFIPSNNFTGIIDSPTREYSWAKYSVYNDDPLEFTRMDGIINILEHGKFDSEILDMLRNNRVPEEEKKSCDLVFKKKLLSFFRSCL
jgi:hypothetical protein